MPPFESLRSRVLVPELMDDPALPAAELDAALRGLRRLNVASRATSSLWNVLRPIAAASPHPLRLVDVAAGSGDVLIGLGRRARRAGLPLELHACDLRPEMLTQIQARAKAAGLDVTSFQFDAFADELPGGFDVAMTSLFCHHLPDQAVISLLGKMARAARHVVVSDLQRTPASLALVWLGSRTLTRSRVVHVDSLLSVRASFAIEEFHEMAKKAGLSDIHFHRCGPARFIMEAKGLV
jgi:2-polyprenyl-3-methyl-5-hydroxy-6-metoxy-1,4-benzoquinol methylase